MYGDTFSSLKVESMYGQFIILVPIPILPRSRVDLALYFLLSAHASSIGVQQYTTSPMV